MMIVVMMARACANWLKDPDVLLCEQAFASHHLPHGWISADNDAPVCELGWEVQISNKPTDAGALRFIWRKNDHEHRLGRLLDFVADPACWVRVLPRTNGLVEIKTQFEPIFSGCPPAALRQSMPVRLQDDHGSRRFIRDIF